MGFRKFLNEFLAVIILLYGLAGMAGSAVAVLGVEGFMQAQIETSIASEGRDAQAGQDAPPEAAAEIEAQTQEGVQRMTSGAVQLAQVVFGVFGLFHFMFFLTGLALLLHKQRLDAIKPKKP